jgi:hypothetical protein
VNGRRLAAFAAATLLLAALVLAAGWAIAAPGERRGVAFGVAAAAAVQLLVTAVAGAVLPANRVGAFGVGMIGRFAAVVGVGMVVVPRAGLPAAATLLSMVAVLFATTLIEPVLHASGARKDS